MQRITADVLCAFGAKKEFYDKARPWLDENPQRRLILVCFEPFLLEERRVKIYPFESPLQIEPLAKEIAWRAALLEIAVLDEIGSEYFPLFKKCLHECHLAAHLLLSDSADWGVTALMRAKVNLACPFRSVFELKDAFRGVPAVIIGAGPSLEKSHQFLEGMQGKALFFAGGAALRFFKKKTHFAAAIDPNPSGPIPSLTNAPFCFQARAHPASVKGAQGERFLAPDPHFPFLNWIAGEDLEPFDSGWTVGNFLTALACLFGCNPILFVGMDYCYRKGKKYPVSSPRLPEGAIRVRNREGRFVWTQRDWIQAVRWTEEFARKHSDRQFLYATAGGLGFQEIIAEGSLEQYPRIPNLEERLRHALLPKKNSAKLRWEEWTQSMKRCLVEPEGEIVHETLLMPLWRVWKPLLEREIDLDPHPLAAADKLRLHQALFFRQVLEEHLRALEKKDGEEKLEGKREAFYEDSTPKTIESYEGGKREGEVLLYWPNGTMKRRVFFHAGKRCGSDQMWSEEGILLDEGRYREGKAVGAHRRWNRKGRLIEEVLYLDAKRFDFRQWDDEGNLRTEALWIEDTYQERVWDRFRQVWIEKKGHWDGEKIVYF